MLVDQDTFDWKEELGPFDEDGIEIMSEEETVDFENATMDLDLMVLVDRYIKKNRTYKMFLILAQAFAGKSNPISIFMKEPDA